MLSDERLEELAAHIASAIGTDGNLPDGDLYDVQAVVLYEQQRRAQKCETCGFWDPNATTWENYGKCEWLHKMFRPRRSGAGPISTGRAFYCCHWKPKEQTP